MSATVYDYTSQVFEPWLIQSNIPRPVLVYADGHKSHLSLEVAEFCTSKGTAKNKWKETHSNENINKKSFPIVFKDAVDQITLSTVVSGCCQWL